MAPDKHTILAEAQPRSGIAEFYRGKVVFITGGTGFLGKILVETLLRCCPDVKKIYLLCRPKKGKSIKERLFYQFKDPLYDEIKKTKPKNLLKVVPIAGDHMKHNLGMKEEDLNAIVNETHIVFHLAATVRFDEDLRLAVPVNVRSTRDILLLARSMTNLSVFVHVSTAYSNCTQKDIEEKFYKPPFDGDRLIELTDELDDETLLRMTPGLLGEYPNTYTFTKCVAEDLVRKYSAGLPIAMVRPSIVMPVYDGPYPGWTDNINGPVGLGIGLALGVIHALKMNRDFEVALIPADFVINGTIAASWNVGTRKPTVEPEGTPDTSNELEQADAGASSAGDGSAVEIYNSVNFENSTTWGFGVDHILGYGLEEPSHNMIWKPFCLMVENYHLFTIYSWLVHWIPAYILDAILLLVGRKPMLVQIYVKATKFLGMFDYFMTHEWNFDSAKLKQLFEKLRMRTKPRFRST